MTTQAQLIVHAQTRGEICLCGRGLHDAYETSRGYLVCRNCSKYRVYLQRQAAPAPLLDPDFDKDILDAQ